MNEIIQVEHVCKYFGGLHAVEDVSIHLNEGEILGLIGANGAGKTTLFNMISGNFPPTSGIIRFNGQEIQKLKPHKIAELGIGTNKGASLTGSVLEDEKVFGTIHIALGDNANFGGKVEAPCHLDGILKSPDLYLDGEQVMKKGKWLI